MKNFIKERNPFLLVSFIISVFTFMLILGVSLSDVDLIDFLKKLLPATRYYYADLGFTIYYTIGLIFIILISLFNISGYLYNKNEHIFIATGLLFICIIFNQFSIIYIIWFFINILGLVKKRNN